MGSIKKISDEVKNNLLSLLSTLGEDGLFQRTVGVGIISATSYETAEIEILDVSDAFFALHRRTGETEYYIIGKVLRRAAHVVYREMRRQNKSKKLNERFLNVV